MTEYCAQFEAALQADNYTPIVANNEEEFKAVVDEFPYKRALDQVKKYINALVNPYCNSSDQQGGTFFNI